VTSIHGVLCMQAAQLHARSAWSRVSRLRDVTAVNCRSSVNALNTIRPAGSRCITQLTEPASACWTRIAWERSVGHEDSPSCAPLTSLHVELTMTELVPLAA
jgi:hypothetical protein